MKFLCDRDVLKDGLASVSGRAKANATIPILQHLLVEAGDNSLKLTGHDLDSCSQIDIPAEVERPGAVAMPSDRFVRLVSGLYSGAQVVVDADDKAAKVKAGRSIYQFSVLPATDFPEVFKPQDPVTIELTAAQLRRLFEAPTTAVSQIKTDTYLRGIYLHRSKGEIVAVGTNRHKLVRTCVPMKSAADFPGIIIPEFACDEFVRLAGDGDATLSIAKNLIAIEAANRRFVSRLIDATFPQDYQRVIPPQDAPTIVVESEELDAALTRLLTATDPGDENPPVVKLSWDDNPEYLRASLRSNLAAGEDEIECDAAERPAGEIGMQIGYLRSMIEAAGGKRLRLYINGQQTGVRIENPDSDDIVAVCATCRW